MYASIIGNAFRMLDGPNSYNFHIFNICIKCQVHEAYTTNME